MTSPVSLELQQKIATWRMRANEGTLTLEEMRELLEVDSLGFLSIDGLYRAMGETGRNNARPQYTDHYFTGDYPTRLLDREIEEGGREVSARQLSLLVSA